VKKPLTKIINGITRIYDPRLGKLNREIIWDWKTQKIGTSGTLKRKATSKHKAKILIASSSDFGSIIANSYLMQAIILMIPVIEEKTANIPKASGVK
jgi:hypothetical protein